MLGLCTYYNLAIISKDELARESFTKNSNIFFSISVIFYIFISTPAQIFTSTSGLLSTYTDINLQKSIKLALKLFVKSQKYGQANFTSYNYLLKASNSNLYYRNLYIEYYYFC